MKNMTIDGERKFVLTKYATRKGVKQIVKSDHNPIWCEFNFQWSSHLKMKKTEAFNFNDMESLANFKLSNDKNVKLIESLKGSDNIVSGGRKWFSELKDSVYKCFKKVRFTSGNKDREFLKLLDEKLKLKREIENCQHYSVPLCTKDLCDKIDAIDDKIARFSTTRDINCISKIAEEMQLRGKFNLLNMWKLRRK